MPLPERLARQVERRSYSIYGLARIGRETTDLWELLADCELALALKFTAVLAAYARLPHRLDRPVLLSDFRELIPDAFWARHFRFGYITYGQGPWCTYFDFDKDEMFYHLSIGPRRSRYGLHGVSFISSRSLLPPGASGLSKGYFNPRLDASVVRFALTHPFYPAELHDGRDIYLFTGQKWTE